MTHVRKQIRDAVETRLTGLTTTATRVHKTRLYSVPELPALLIYTTDEPAELDGKPASVWRDLELSVHGLVGVSADTLDDTLDQIALEVEQAMASDVTFGGLVKRSRLTRTQMGLASEGEGKKQYGSVQMTYVMTYRTAESDPESTNH